MNFENLYSYRQESTSQAKRDAVWKVIAGDLYRRLGSPEAVLDPACGRGEFIKHVPSKVRWAGDQSPRIDDADHSGIHMFVGDMLQVELPECSFDAVLLSNVLEHLDHYESIQRLLGKLKDSLREGGVVGILGPNFRYSQKVYFDCADHVLPLTHVTVAEHLQAAGYGVDEVIPRFLPYSFRGRLPSSPLLASLYLKFPPAWRVLGKQFLVIGRRRTEDARLPLDSVPNREFGSARCSLVRTQAEQAPKSAI